MHEVRTEIELEASPEAVWELLGDVRNYQQWSKIFSFPHADVRPGGFGILRVQIGSPLPAFLPVRFDVLEPNQEIRWHGGAKALGYGNHYMRLEPVEGNRTHLVHGETFQGLAIRAGWPLLGNKLPGAYAAFNREIARALR